MTELNFKGREFVRNHHLAVPFHPLELQADKGIGKPSLSDNLIIHGDNLYALKAIFPQFVGKIDCIFIDPPYNTGNQEWCYNDNVNSPMLNEWLNANPISIEDGLRHDKWCTMMWPRLRLLHGLMSKEGVIFIAIDDNELTHLRMMMDTIFGSQNFVANFVWRHRRSSQNDIDISLSHNYLVCYAFNRKEFSLRTGKVDPSKFTNPDNDPRGPWVADPFDAPNVRENLSYEIKNPKTGETFLPPVGRCWRFSQEKYLEVLSQGRIVFGKRGVTKPQYKRYLSEAEHRGQNVFTIWDDVGTATSATKELQRIFGEKRCFPTPKPVQLLRRVIELSTNSDSIVLDSFAGSGTTAHAVLEANHRDGGNRRFVLVECEQYADTITAERIRRVINGYPFKGTLRTEFWREKLTWNNVKNTKGIIESIESIENFHGHEFDRIQKTVKDGELIVTGEKKVNERTVGLGGSFTYYTLGEAVDLDKLIGGKTLPSFEAIGGRLYHMATNRKFDPKVMSESDFYLGEFNDDHVWLLYKPNIKWLKSSDSALTLSRAKFITELKPEGHHFVFAPVRYLSRKVISDFGFKIEFIPFPYSLYRVFGY